jgi:hypothetical protein
MNERKLGSSVFGKGTRVSDTIEMCSLFNCFPGFRDSRVTYVAQNVAFAWGSAKCQDRGITESGIPSLGAGKAAFELSGPFLFSKGPYRVRQQRNQASLLAILYISENLRAFQRCTNG